MSNKSIATIATMRIDIGENSFHVVGLDRRGAIVLRQKWSRGRIEARIANMPPCLIGMEACEQTAAWKQLRCDTQRPST
jgi:transposase